MSCKVVHGTLFVFGLAREENMSKKGNPFRKSFFGFALIASVILGIGFLSILHDRNHEMKGHHYQERADALLKDFLYQTDVFEKIALHISINNAYQPLQLAKQKYNEYELLNDFVQYQQYSVLTDELFLYYSNNRNLFHVKGKTVDIDVYLSALSEDEKLGLMEKLSDLGAAQDVVWCGEQMYILTPVNLYSVDRQVKAVLVAVVEQDALLERFEYVSGSLEGSVSLYKDGELLYSGGGEEERKAKDSYEAEDPVKGFVISYRPDNWEYLSLERSLLQLGLILADIWLVFAISSLFARRAYKPLWRINEKYRDREELSDSPRSDNALEEIENMLDFSLENCVVTAQRLEKQKELLRSQVLRMLLNGTYSTDARQYLERLNIAMPGPFFFVMSIQPPKEALSDKSLSALQTEMEGFTSVEENEYIYAIYDQEQKLLWVICSYADEERAKEIEECIAETAESFAAEVCIGVGQTYASPGKISISWLESMDDLTNQMNLRKAESQVFTYNAESLRGIVDALSRGARDEALKELGYYTAYLKEKQPSLLMKQYIFTEFIGEVSLLCRKYRVKVSNRNLSLIINSKSLENFNEAARTLIREFCDKYAAVKEKKVKESSELICRYMKEHCAEYDLSVGKVAAELGIPNTVVRDSVYDLTGKNFRDYIVFLRVEYAKELLVAEKLPVHEVGEKVGYSSVSHFIKIFKEETGQTPAKYVRDHTAREGWAG